MYQALFGYDGERGNSRMFTGFASLQVTFAIGSITWACTVVASTLMPILVYHRVAITSGEPVAACMQNRKGKVYRRSCSGKDENFTVVQAMTPIFAFSFAHEACTFWIFVTWTSMPAERCSFEPQESVRT